MVNFYVPNYTKEEFEELDNKVLLLSKEKYSQLNIKFKEKCCSIILEDCQVTCYFSEYISNE